MRRDGAGKAFLLEVSSVAPSLNEETIRYARRDRRRLRLGDGCRQLLSTGSDIRRIRVCG
jgi:hypothetical protein